MKTTVNVLSILLMAVLIGSSVIVMGCGGSDDDSRGNLLKITGCSAIEYKGILWGDGFCEDVGHTCIPDGDVVSVSEAPFGLGCYETFLTECDGDCCIKKAWVGEGVPETSLPRCPWNP